MNIPSPPLSVSSVWRLYAWGTVSTSTGTVKCITHWMTHQLRLEPLHSMKSSGRSSTSSRTKQELSPRTSCVSTNAPSMANPMVRLFYSLGFLPCVLLHPQRLNLISRRECKISAHQGCLDGLMVHLPCINFFFFSHSFISLFLPQYYPSYRTDTISFSSFVPDLQNLYSNLVGLLLLLLCFLISLFR